MNVIPDVKQKSLFEQSLEKLDLQGTLVLMTVLADRALFLQAKDTLNKKTVVKPNLIHA